MKTIAHHQLADAQTIPKHCYPPVHHAPALHAEHEATKCGISIGSVGISCPSYVPSQILAHPQPAHWQGGVTSKKCPDTV